MRSENIFRLHGVHDAEGIRAALAQGQARDVTIVGGGLIGVETAEALAEHGCRLTVVEMMPQILRMLDPEMAGPAERHLESHAVRVMTGAKVVAYVCTGGCVCCGRHCSEYRFWWLICNDGPDTRNRNSSCCGRG